ncbi:hypothetical protein I6A84_11175 [Frankia sp. CNm7]|uniref:Nucleotide exchange factor GrpE n=1 Tax=Frankia nepalensis TaxID=1836974 RepID=A0A937RQQ7_9ACTN|nr:hypothetical protein [Frankia nepalensis]MBL7497506.1 hypothetical protein [Frankia nepalensis]MBL7510227.1 hypothetical protein [Frankia nepalensis]MBL7518657.1 hypothetical protein [Frankia nepalensis]MBL7630938.1 hypothetical protein [Frankia nepalensis]
MALFRRQDRATAGTAETVPAPAGSADVPRETVAGQLSAGEAAFELREALGRIRELEHDLEAARREAGRAGAAGAGAAVDEVAEAIATPLAHLATQVALVRAGGGVLTVDDLAEAAGRLFRALERAGILLDGDVGAAAAFDPTRHLPPAGGEPAPGTAVVLRSPAVRVVGGRVVRRSTVTAGAGEAGGEAG